MAGAIPAAGPGRYRALLRAPDIGAMLAWSMVARLPIGMVPLALIMLVREHGGSYGQAGVVVGAYSVALAAAAPYAGRKVDRRGPARVILLRGLAFPGLLGCLAALALVGAPPLALAPVAAAAGALLPPVAAAMRTLWPRLLPGELRSTAYALDAALQEVFFVLGPLLVAVLALAAPVLALVGAALAAAAGTIGFVRVPSVAVADAVERGHDRRLGALGFGGMRTIVLLAVAWGMAFGIVEVATPPSPRRMGHARSRGSRSPPSRSAASSGASSPGCGRPPTSAGVCSWPRPVSPSC